jgi:hypothetical protein
MSHGFGLWIESVVALLLLFTIATCVVLDRRLKRFKADEQSLKAIISELFTATEIAERAIAGLKETVHDCDRTLGERLRSAERYSADIALQVGAGEAVLDRLSRVVTAARTLPDGPPQTTADVRTMAEAVRAGADHAPEPLSDARAMVLAAQAFTDRMRGRRSSLAA